MNTYFLLPLNVHLGLVSFTYQSSIPTPMATLLVIVFVVGYALIAMEHPLKLDKAALSHVDRRLLLVGFSLWL